MALALRPVIFRDNALEELRQFPIHAKRDAGYQLDLVQHHRAPDNWKPFEPAASGVQEICLTDEAGVQRFISVFLLDSGLHILHCYQRTSPKSNQRNTENVIARCEALLADVPAAGEQFEIIWNAIESTPESAQSLRLRSTLVRLLREHIQHKEFSAADAAKCLGITQPRLQDLQRGFLNLFSLEALVNMSASAGLQINVSVTPIG